MGSLLTLWTSESYHNPTCARRQRWRTECVASPWRSLPAAGWYWSFSGNPAACPSSRFAANAISPLSLLLVPKTKVSWIALFAKAYGLAARRHVHLRRNWLTFPWARIYEHPHSECVVLVERDWQGEEIVLGAKVRAPEDAAVAEIDRHIRRFRSEPVASISPFRQMLRIARYPALIRRLIFWSSLNCSGSQAVQTIRHVSRFEPGQLWVRIACTPCTAHGVFDLRPDLRRRACRRQPGVRSSRDGWPARGTGTGRSSNGF